MRQRLLDGIHGARRCVAGEHRAHGGETCMIAASRAAPSCVAEMTSAVE